MAKLIPRRFTQTQENAIASYDFTDISNATGYVKYYAGIDTLSGSTALSGGNYVMSPIQFYGDLVSLRTSVMSIPEGAAINQYLSGSFSVEFKKPQIIKGDVIFTVPIGIKSGAGPTGNLDLFPVVTLEKTSAGATTTLTTLTGALWRESVVADETKAGLFNLKGAIAKTKVKVDDIIRMNVKVLGRGQSGGVELTNITLMMMCDPQGRLTSERENTAYTFASGDVTTMTMQLPFRIDL